MLPLIYEYLKFPLLELMEVHPKPNHECVSARYNPFTGKLTMVSVRCKERATITNIVCQKKFHSAIPDSLRTSLIYITNWTKVNPLVEGMQISFNTQSDFTGNVTKRYFDNMTILHGNVKREYKMETHVANFTKESSKIIYLALSSPSGDCHLARRLPPVLQLCHEPRPLRVSLRKL